MKTAEDMPLVLLHGYPFDHTLWYPVVASLGAGVKILAPVLPGFGNTAPPDNHPSLDTWADWLARYLDERNVPSAVIGGMSMGGYVTLAFAERYPKRVAGLCLISTQAAADSEEARRGREEMIKRLRKEGPAAAAAAVLPKMFGKSNPPGPELLEYPRLGAAAAGVEGLIWALQAMASRPDRTELVRSLHIPIFFAHGTEDQIIPFDRMRSLAETAFAPQFLTLKAGHATPLETPDMLAQGLSRFMEIVRGQPTKR
jgi:3-oxoadipate enol-lactonase